MGFRKVIKFGRSSFVVSLPTTWVERNNISKGDNIEVIEEPGVLIIEAQGTKQEEKKEITIQIESQKEIKAQMVSAYVNNYDLITLTSSDLVKHSSHIRELSNIFIGLEIVEETAKRIVLQDFMNIKNTNINEILKRFDRTLKAMMQDALSFVNGKNTYSLVFNKEEDINRLTFFLFKVLKKALRPINMQLLKLKPQDIIRLWEAVIFMERIGDEIKRFVRDIDIKGTEKDLIPLLEAVFHKYDRVMKAYNTNNSKAALDITIGKTEIPKMGDKFLEIPKNKDYEYAIARLNAINSYVRSIANCILRFESE